MKSVAARTIALTALISLGACLPLAVGTLVTGAGTVATGRLMYQGDCDTEGCVYSNAAATVIMVIGLGLAIGGGIGIAVHENQ